MSRMIEALVLLMTLGAMPGVAQEDATALVMAGGQAFIEGDLAEAEKQFEAALAIDPELPVPSGRRPIAAAGHNRFPLHHP